MYGKIKEDLARDLQATRDAGLYKEVVCGLSVVKTCLVPPPPPAPFVCSDAKPIDELTMIWAGTQSIRIKAWKGNVGSTLRADIDNIAPGAEVTVTGFAGSPNDVIWEIFAAGTDTKLGESPTKDKNEPT